MIPVILTTILTAIVIIFLTLKHIYKKNRRNELKLKALPQHAIEIIQKNVPLYTHMPHTLKEQLHGLINIFIAEKAFRGCQGLEITDEIKYTIAAQACILLLNRKTKFFSRLKTIYIYPHTYVAKQVISDGTIEIAGKSVRLGESWQNGPVVLAWDSVTGGARNIKDGRNVVFHEFSHQLDQEDGSADGAPILENRSCYASWAKVLSSEYETLKNKKKKHSRSVMSKYGTTNPAEFFAVATETFFEKPKQMLKRHPQLYHELKEYYKVDPIEWN